MKKYIRADVIDFADEDWATHLELADNPDTRPSTLAYLCDLYTSQRTGDLVLHKIAQNPNTPVQCLRKLMNSHNYSVIMNLIYNSALPSEMIDELAARYNQYHDTLAELILEHPNTSLQTMLKVCEDYAGYPDVIDTAKHALFRYGYHL